MNNQNFRRSILAEAARGFGAELAGAVTPTAADDSDDSADKDPGEVYRDRNLLVFALARSIAVRLGVAHVGTYMHNEWAVVAVKLPAAGTVSWHVRPETVPDWIPDREAGEWYDGHDRDEKNRRVEAYAEGKMIASLEVPTDE